MPATYEIIFPIYNKFSLAGSARTFILNSNSQIHTIPNEQYGAISKGANASTYIPAKPKALTISNNIEEPEESFINDYALSTMFALNSKASPKGVTIKNAFVLRHVRVWKLHKIYDTSLNTPTQPNQRNVLPNAVQPAEIGAIIDASMNAINKSPVMRTTLRRFYATCIKKDSHERIIDLSICLESMFNSSTEISFQFSLFNSIISTDCNKVRVDRFELLKQLYSWRSKIVHGSTLNKSVEEIDEAIDSLINLASVAILYKMQYLSNKDPNDWQIHLRNLALGADELVWSNDDSNSNQAA